MMQKRTTRWNRPLVIATFLISMVGPSLEAQHVDDGFFREREEQNTIALSAEMDPALFWGLRYGRAIPFAAGGFASTMQIQAGVKSYTFDYTDLHGSVQIFLLGNRRFNIIGHAGLEGKYSTNMVHRAYAVNGILGVMPGYFGGRWYGGAEILYKRGLANHLAHTSYYREIYPDVQDGWYSSRMAYLFLSLNGGYRITPRLALSLRAGLRFTTDFENYSPYLIPYCGNLALIYGF